MSKRPKDALSVSPNGSTSSPARQKPKTSVVSNVETNEVNIEEAPETPETTLLKNTTMVSRNTTESYAWITFTQPKPREDLLAKVPEDIRAASKPFKRAIGEDENSSHDII